MSNLIQLFQGSKTTGKTTLFKILSDQEHLDSGELIRSKGLRMGYLTQHDQWTPNETVEEFLSKDCLMPIWSLKALGHDLGLTETMYYQSVESLSGGFRMRCKLLQLLGKEPDILLLDEPTNYLDLESLLALERFLQDYRGAFLLISHDREFLRRTTDHILEIESGSIIKFNGSLDDYFVQKDLLKTQLAARALSVEEKRREILEFVARFGAKASKAAQAQSRLKSLDRLEKIEIKTALKTAVIRLPEPIRTGKLVATLSEINLGYGETVVLQDVVLALERDNHLAVVGVNGAGKSTLLKVLAGKLKPLKGEIKYGYQVSVGYYAQHVSEELNPEKTVFQEMGAKAHPDITQQQILNLAGSLLFSGDEVKKPVSILSGGEKSRVALGQILLQKAPLLVLDEPTNHLDFQTVEVLTQALAKYTGTVVVVSHDRSFIGRVGNKILEIHDGRVDHYLGSYDEYVWSCQKGMFATRNLVCREDERPEKKADFKKVNLKEEKKIIEKTLRKAERERFELEDKLGWQQTRMRFLNEKLAHNPNHSEVKNWITELGTLQKELETTERQWIIMVEKIEKLEKKK
ncbi:MAG: ABC-F family ATP-binding cassette domain-containing protein [Deltaproteobacteria bacterium]|nr:ABC-F family ATP-binding cassette domain-containing protein [Deltaproteobacteria bacterium]